MAIFQRQVIYFIIGNSIIVLGLIIGHALPPLIELIINKQIALTPDSKSYPMWLKSPVPIIQKFYFYNVTNPQEIELGQRPRLDEIGPFTYRSEWHNEDIELSDDRSKIDFRHIKQWYFEPELSVADHKLLITTINAPLAVTMSLIQSAPSAVRYVVTFSLDGFSEGFFTRRSIKQLLFDGYPDLLTTVGPFLNSEMLSQGGQFAYFNSKNNSEDAHYEINTGYDEINKLNTITKYNGKPALAFWRKQCNSLEGSSPGEMFPPLSENQTQLRLFQPDFCRVWNLNYDSNYEHPSGLRLRRFRASRDIFRNSTDFPDNHCYYPKYLIRPISRVRHEWPNGVFSLAPCKFNAPIYLSMPHFLGADPYYARQVNGLEANETKHDFYMDIEPRTGAPVAAAARVQVNLAISRPPGLIRFRNIPEIMFPVFWQELSVNLSDRPDILENLLLASRYAQENSQRVASSLVFMGVAVLLTSLLFFIHSII